MTEPGIGHNSEAPGTRDSVSGEELKQFLERIERLEGEKQALADDVKDIYAECKGRGFDTKVMRRIVALRKIDSGERAETAAILQLYADAIGMENVFA